MVDVPETMFSIRPVGVVVSDFKECTRSFNYNRASMICMRADLADALVGLECFSHLHVIYYQHRRDEWIKLIEQKRAKTALTITGSVGEASALGIYTTRSPSRPSALGSCVVEIIKCEGNHIYVKGLDALDGTPVLDIKVYIPQYDSFPGAEAPLDACVGGELISTSRHLNWDNINVGLTLGLRTGAKALQAAGIERGEAVLAEVVGGHFFAQGIEGSTGCSVMKNNMVFEEDKSSLGNWSLKITGNNSKVEIRLKEYSFSGAREVLELDEEKLFAYVKARKDKE